MSLSVPTVRKTKGNGELPGPKPGGLKNRRISRKLLPLTVCALVLGGALYLTYILTRDSAHLRVLAHIPGGEMVAVHSSAFVVTRQGSLEVVSPDGTVQGAGASYESILPSGPWLIGLSSNSMSLIQPLRPSSPEFSLTLGHGERPVPLLDGDMLITCIPLQGLKFGEPWQLRAISKESKIMWHSQIPYAPLFGISAGGRLIIAAVDISGGGNLWMLCLSADTGKLLWQERLGQGAWRYLALASDGNIMAVLDSWACSITPQGQVAWAYRPAGTILSAVSDSGVLALSVSKAQDGAISKLLGNAQVVALSSGGDILWEYKTTDELPRVFAHDGRLVVLESDRFACLDLQTGGLLVSAKLDGYPITCAKNVILIYKDNGLLLIDPGIPKSAR